MELYHSPCGITVAVESMFRIEHAGFVLSGHVKHMTGQQNVRCNCPFATDKYEQWAVSVKKLIVFKVRL